MLEVVVWGASGHARVVADAARLQGHTIAGFLDDNPARVGESFAGASVLGGATNLGEIRARGVRYVHIAVGHCAARAKLAEVAGSHGFELVSVVHPRATVAADVPIGAGTFIAAGAIVNPGTRIGRLVILNTGCTVDHDCTVEDGAHIGPGAHLGGVVHIESLAWIGIGASLRDRVRIGRATTIGAGAVVVSNIESQVVAYGVPARVARAKRAGE